jgi:ABC-type polysaccharide/polyol phosphate export permease
VAVKDATGRIVRVRALAWSFAQRDLKARFKDTALGWVWALAIPLSTLAVYSVVFGLIFQTGAPRFGNSREPIYAVWLFCGLVAFGFFSGGVIRGIDALIGASTLMRKVSVPPYAPVLGSLIAGGFQTLVEITLALVVLAALGNVSATWLLVPVWAVVFFAFTAGIAMLFAIASAHLRDIAQITTVLMQFIFFATPVIYPADLIPPDALGGHLRTALEANPIGHFVELFRDLTYGLHSGGLADWLYVVVAAGIALSLGALVSERYGRDLAEKM